MASTPPRWGVGARAGAPFGALIETYYLSSLDSARSAPVRRCEVRRRIAFDTGKQALLCDISPSVIGQDFGRGDDIEVVVLTARHEGVDLDPISEFPCFVHVSTSSRGYTDLATPIRTDALEVLGWGELYRTEADAENHSFGP